MCLSMAYALSNVMDVLTENQFASYVLLSLSACIFIVFVFRQSASNLPPGPRNPLFFLSLRGGNQFISLTNASHQYGAIYSFRAGRMLMVVLNNYQLVKEAFVTKSDDFSSRFQSPAVTRGIGLKGSVLRQNGKPWKELRRFGMQALRNFGVGKKCLENKISTEAEFLGDAIAQRSGNLFDPTQVLSFAVSNIICNITFGSRFDYSSQTLSELLSLLRELTSSVSLSDPVHFLPFLYVLPRYKRNRARAAKVTKFIQDIVAEHRETWQEDDIRDIIDMYLLEGKRQSRDLDLCDIFDPSYAWRFIFDLFAAGSDTTTHSISWALLMLCMHPDIQEKVNLEMKNYVYETGKPLSVDAMPSLPFTVATICEIQRIRPVAPFTGRMLESDVTIGEFSIPKGSFVLANIWAVHHDPKIWNNPEEFNPKRFLSDDGKDVVRNEAFIPFSIGRRTCMGENLAKMEMFVFLSSLIQRFRFYIPEEEGVPDLIGIQGITLGPSKYRLCAETRATNS